MVDCDCAVEVVISDKEEIRRINNENRGIDSVTDVLSFPMFASRNEICADESGSAFLGQHDGFAENALRNRLQEYGHSC